MVITESSENCATVKSRSWSQVSIATCEAARSEVIEQTQLAFRPLRGKFGCLGGCRVSCACLLGSGHLPW